MKVIGVVGGIGAGKTTVVTMIAAMTNAPIIGADGLGHEILLKGGLAYESVCDTFGRSILDASGQIVRSKLAAIVFQDRAALDQLNAITHPLIYNCIKEAIATFAASGQHALVVVDAALLVEGGLVPLMDVIIGVDAPESIRIERIKARDGATEEQAKDRISKQKKWQELKKVVDYSIDTSTSHHATKQQVTDILEAILSRT